MRELPKITAQDYVAGVLSGDILACRWVKLAVKRHVRDLKQAEKKTGKFYFDEEAARRPIDFIHLFCKHIKGDLKGAPITLEPWQQFVTWTIFGWKKKKDGKRRFNTIFIEVAKKNGKSTWVAGIALYLFSSDGEGGAEVYSVATTKDQARIVFNDYARAMVLASEGLREDIHVLKHAMTNDDETGTFRALSSDRDGLDGKHVHCAVVDEYHAHKDAGVYTIMEQGMSSRTQPMMIVITTAGFDPSVPCVGEEEYAQEILKGTQKNDSYFAIIYTLDKKDNWTNKKTWVKANPNLGISKQLERMEAEFDKALARPSEQSKFKNKQLNIWTVNKERWIKDTDWNRLHKKFDVEEMRGYDAYGGIDLSKTVDTTAYALAIPWEGRIRLIVKIFLPDHELLDRKNRERFEWPQMAKEGHVKLTPGRTVDYDFIQTELENDFKFYNIIDVAYDSFNASQFINNINKAGYEDRMVEFSQGWQTVNAAAKDFEIKLLNKGLEVFPNPVMDWMVGNTEIIRDTNGNIRPVKNPKRQMARHIDGVVASMMACDMATRAEDTSSVYEEAGEEIFIG